MWLSMKRALLLISLTKSAFVVSQDLSEFPALNEPAVLWEQNILPQGGLNSPNVRRGNGVFISPDQSMVVSTSVGGTASAFDAFTGSILWEFDPPRVDGKIVTCPTGVTFVSGEEDQFGNISTEPYLVYTVVDNEAAVDARSRVVALTMDGQEKWISGELEGVAIGSPRASSKGDYIFQNTNSQLGSVGHFSVVWGAQDGQVFFSQQNTTQAFGPLGIDQDPAEGYYEGGNGDFNTNEILMWSATPKPTDGTVGDGAIFAFQFPVDFMDDASDLSYILLGTNARDFQTISFPVLANNGRSVYFSTSRSGYVAWIGVEGLNRFKFNRAPNAGTGFTRGNPPSQGVFSAPALSSSEEEPFVFGGTSANEFVRLSFDFSQETVVTTSTPVHAQAIVSAEDSFVYYIEQGGIIHQANFNDISDRWTQDLMNPVEGEFAIRANGSVIYVADVTGKVTAFRVTEIPATPEPSAAPTATVSEVPTPAPVVPTDAPTVAPTVKTSPVPSDFPSLMPSSPPGDRGISDLTSGASQSLSLAVIGIAALLCTLF